MNNTKYFFSRSLPCIMGTRSTNQWDLVKSVQIFQDIQVVQRRKLFLLAEKRGKR